MADDGHAGGTAATDHPTRSRDEGPTGPAHPASGPVIHKFGGSSVGTAERIGRVAGLVLAEPAPLVVVVSALSGVTDLLVEAGRAVAAGDTARVDALRGALQERHEEAIRELALGEEESAPLRERTEAVLDRLGRAATAGGGADEVADEVAALGEDLSSGLVAAALRARGADAVAVDARTVVRTDDRFGRARPDRTAVAGLARRHLVPELEAGRIPVVGGFLGATADGRTTTLGRGGSNHTAAILAAALGSPEIQIWTDVDGVLSGDPRAVETPRVLPEIGFEEAVELAYFGAKVLHPGAAKHAVSSGIPIRIRNTFAPEVAGTLILPDRRGVREVAAVAYKPGVVLVKVRSHPTAMPYGFLARVFEILARHELPVDLVATSHSSTAFTLDENEEMDRVAAELSGFAEVEVFRTQATVTVVGQGLLEEPGIDARVFDAVERTAVNLISQASDVSLSLVVDGAEAPALVRRLHAALIEHGVHDEEAGP